MNWQNVCNVLYMYLYVAATSVCNKLHGHYAEFEIVMLWSNLTDISLYIGLRYDTIDHRIVGLSAHLGLL